MIRKIKGRSKGKKKGITSKEKGRSERMEEHKSA